MNKNRNMCWLNQTEKCITFGNKIKDYITVQEKKNENELLRELE